MPATGSRTSSSLTVGSPWSNRSRPPPAAAAAALVAVAVAAPAAAAAALEVVVVLVVGLLPRGPVVGAVVRSAAAVVVPVAAVARRGCRRRGCSPSRLPLSRFRAVAVGVPVAAAAVAGAPGRRRPLGAVAAAALAVALRAVALGALLAVGRAPRGVGRRRGGRRSRGVVARPRASSRSAEPAGGWRRGGSGPTGGDRGSAPGRLSAGQRAAVGAAAVGASSGAAVGGDAAAATGAGGGRRLVRGRRRCGAADLTSDGGDEVALAHPAGAVDAQSAARPGARGAASRTGRCRGAGRCPSSQSGRCLARAGASCAPVAARSVVSLTYRSFPAVTCAFQRRGCPGPRRSRPGGGGARQGAGGKFARRISGEERSSASAPREARPSGRLRREPRRSSRTGQHRWLPACSSLPRRYLQAVPTSTAAPPDRPPAARTVHPGGVSAATAAAGRSAARPAPARWAPRRRRRRHAPSARSRSTSAATPASRRALPLVQPVLGGRRAAAPGRGSARATSRAARPALRGVGVRHARAAARGRRASRACRRARAPPARRPGATSSRTARAPVGVHPAKGRPAEQAGRDVVGMPLELGGQPQDRVVVDGLDVRAQRPGAQHPGDDGRRGRAQPPPVRDGVLRDHAQPGRRPAELVAGRAEGADDQVRLVGGQRRPRPRR